MEYWRRDHQRFADGHPHVAPEEVEVVSCVGAVDHLDVAVLEHLEIVVIERVSWHRVVLVAELEEPLHP